MKSISALFTLILLALPLGAACDSSAGKQSQATGPTGRTHIDRFDELTIERTACLGACPIYAVRILGDGRVEFEGKAYVKTRGKATGSLSGEQMAELLAAINEADFSSLRDQYRRGGEGCRTDHPSVITSIKVGDREEKIHHDYGCESDSATGKSTVHPKTLTDLENRIEEIAGTVRWVGTREERSER